jgi:hypothetical protein
LPTQPEAEDATLSVGGEGLGDDPLVYRPLAMCVRGGQPRGFGLVSGWNRLQMSRMALPLGQATRGQAIQANAASEGITTTGGVETTCQAMSTIP